MGPRELVATGLELTGDEGCTPEDPDERGCDQEHRGKGCLQELVVLQELELGRTTVVVLRAVRHRCVVEVEKVRVRIPKGKSVKNVKLLVNAAAPHSTVVNGFVEVDVPPFELNEAVAIDWA